MSAKMESVYADLVTGVVKLLTGHVSALFFVSAYLENLRCKFLFAAHFPCNIHHMTKIR